MSTLWPHLPDTVAGEIYERVARRGAEELSDACALRHPAQVFTATGGTRADDKRVQALRDVIVSTAQAHGFPGGGGRIAFDRDLASRLLEEMDLAVAEAADRRLWSFIALVVAPDVTAWRWEGSSNRERWICRDPTRRMFSRLWWHAYLLSDPATGRVEREILDQLTEADLNQLFERRRIGGNRRVLRSLACAVLAVPDASRRALIRDASKRVLRRMAVVDFHALTDEEVEREVGRLVAEANLALATASGREDGSDTSDA
jgi:hypothetical protein